MTTYELGGQSFSSKEAIRAHIRSVRAATPKGFAVTDPAVLALLQLHPEWMQKSIEMQFVTVDWVKRAPAAPRSLEIAILQADGTLMDISWSKILKWLTPAGDLAMPTPAAHHLNELRAAARHDIDYQIDPLRRPGHHVDHTAPQTFEVLLRSWFDTLSVPLLSIAISDRHGPLVIRSIAADDLRMSWQRYHLENAVLQVITTRQHAALRKVTVDWSDVLNAL